MTTKTPRRREFIAAIREMIVKNCPVGETPANEMIDHWRDGGEPRHPLDQGIFGMCDKIAQDLDERDAADEGGDK